MRMHIGIGVLAGISLLGVSLSPAQAQGPAGTQVGKPGDRAGRAGGPGRGRMGGGVLRNPKIIKELGITEAQQKQINTLFEKTSARRKAIRDDKTLTDDQRKAKMQEVGKEATAALEKVFTPAQNAKIKEMRKKAMTDRRAKDGKPGAKP